MEEELVLGQCYVLRNGMKTGPLRISEIRTSYCYEADIPQEDGSKYIFQFKDNGKYLTNDMENRYDIIKKQDDENT
jgi:hypothetical protein